MPTRPRIRDLFGRLPLVVVATGGAVLLAACGDVKAPQSGSSETFGVQTSPPSVQPTIPSSTSAAPTDTSGTPVTSLPEFVFTAETSTGLLPPEYYEFSSCEPTAAARQAGDVHPSVDVGPIAVNNATELLAQADTIFVGTVLETNPPVFVTPVNLPSSYLAVTGLLSGEDVAWGVTPTVLAVDQVLAGAPGPTVTTSELGCFAEGSLPVLQPGARILMLANTVDPRFGPYSFFGGTHSIVDWFEVDTSEQLVPRSSLLGLPSHAPFFEGVSLGDAIADFTNAADQPNSTPPEGTILG